MVPSSTLAWRTGGAFWLFGLTNNIFWVIVLSAALDLVGPSIPKATVLLASTLPSLFVKLASPYVIQSIPFTLRILLLVAFSTCGLLAVALSPAGTDASSITSKMTGIVLGAIASGFGEVNFLGLTHYYGEAGLTGWSSGTGGAGVVGGSFYALVTTAFGWSVRTTLIVSLIFPATMLFSYLAVLPRGLLRAPRLKHGRSDSERRIYQDGDGESERAERRPEARVLGEEGSIMESASLLDHEAHRHAFPAYADPNPRARFTHAWATFRSKLHSTRKLLVPYMGPLFLVYFAEYVINQGIAPTLLFPLSESPFHNYRAFYPTYGAIYQAGVFLSRSSLPFIRVRKLYLPALLQVLNMIILALHAMYNFLGSVYIIFLITFWEGILGGLVYVSAFADIREEVAEEEREFSLGMAAVADSFGILTASIIGAVMETFLCEWQVRRGRDWCTRL